MRYSRCSVPRSYFFETEEVIAGSKCDTIYLVYHDLNHHEVEDGAPEDHPPQDGMGPGEWSVGEGKDGNDHEVDEHAAQAGPDVATVVGSVSEKF